MEELITYLITTSTIETGTQISINTRKMESFRRGWEAGVAKDDHANAKMETMLTHSLWQELYTGLTLPSSSLFYLITRGWDREPCGLKAPSTDHW